MNIPFLSNLKILVPEKETKTFKGGAHPDAMKSLTNRLPIVDVPAPKTLVFPMSQHLGTPATPCVQVGDTVLAGQKIAEAGGFVSANIHSSVSGKVIAIEERMNHFGLMINSIVIENDEQDMNEFEAEPRNFKDFTPAELVDMVREAGIVGMGGATFPTHIKLSPPEGKTIDTVIINGAECEPCLTSDHRAMLETPKEVLTGLKIMLKIFGLKKGYIGIEENKADAIELLTNYAHMENDYEIEIVPLKVKYPQGSEKHLINAITGRTVPVGKLPLDVGCVVNNIDTCAAIARAVVYGMPLISRIVTVTGDCIKNPTNARVRIGTPMGDVIEYLGGLKAQPKKVIMGGPMMGIAVPNLDVPIVKGSSGIVALSKRSTLLRHEGICVRCGKCVSACPMGLSPLFLKEAIVAGDFDRMKELDISACIECGSCSYVCPGANNPSQSIKTARLRLRNMG